MTHVPYRTAFTSVRSGLDAHLCPTEHSGYVLSSGCRPHVYQTWQPGYAMPHAKPGSRARKPGRVARVPGNSARPTLNSSHVVSSHATSRDNLSTVERTRQSQLPGCWMLQRLMLATGRCFCCCPCFCQNRFGRGASHYRHLSQLFGRLWVRLPLPIGQFSEI